MAGLVERAVRIERLVRALHKDGKEGRSSFEARLKDPAQARAFFGALFELLAGKAPDRDRFEALAAAAAATSAAAAPDESAWGFVTLLPFVARPDLHVPLRPRSTCEAAHRLGLDLAFDAQPNWKTYSALLAAAGVLLERLRPLGAKDHVDVDAFMHLVVVRQPGPAKPVAATVQADA